MSTNGFCGARLWSKTQPQRGASWCVLRLVLRTQSRSAPVQTLSLNSQPST